VETPAKLLARYDADVIVYGHTHKQLVVNAGGRWVVNPGAAPPLLTTGAERLEILVQSPLDYVLLLRFDRVQDIRDRALKDHVRGNSLAFGPLLSLGLGVVKRLERFLQCGGGLHEHHYRP